MDDDWDGCGIDADPSKRFKSRNVRMRDDEDIRCHASSNPNVARGNADRDSKIV